MFGPQLMHTSSSGANSSDNIGFTLSGGAIGEAAPMITISALVFLTFTPAGPTDRFTVLPIQIFNWVGLPQEDFRGVAAAGILVLLILLLAMNSLAIYVRNKFQRRY